MGHIPTLDEAGRLAALAEYDILDTAPEQPFERIVRLVRMLLDVPMATVTFVDSDRQWFKARRGVEVCETSRSIAICDHAIRADEPLVVPDLRDDARFRDLLKAAQFPPILAYLGIPLVTPDGYAVGTLCAMDHVTRDFTAEDIAVMRELAGVVLDLLEMRRVAQSDFLTGAMTRRAFVKDVEREIVRHRRHARPAALVAFDIDHFKRINDTYGHGGGDRVLEAVGKLGAGALRSGDVLARLGGEEFALLLPETGPEKAGDVAERFRQAIADMAVPDLAGHQVTASFGVAPLTGDYGFPDEWLAAADRALYRAKEDGRNRVCTAPGDGAAA